MCSPVLCLGCFAVAQYFSFSVALNMSQRTHDRGAGLRGMGDTSFPDEFMLSANGSFLFENSFSQQNGPSTANGAAGGKGIPSGLISIDPNDLRFLEKRDTCSLTDDEVDALSRAKRRQDAFKTALCDAFRRTGECSYGPGCRFAHAQEELRVPAQPRGRMHPKYKTVLCENFERDERCKYGQRCQFIHRRKNGDTSMNMNTSVVDASPMPPMPVFTRSRRSTAAFDGNVSLPFGFGAPGAGYFNALRPSQLNAPDFSGMPLFGGDYRPKSRGVSGGGGGGGMGNRSMRRMAPSPSNPAADDSTGDVEQKQMDKNMLAFVDQISDMSLKTRHSYEA